MHLLKSQTHRRGWVGEAPALLSVEPSPPCSCPGQGRHLHSQPEPEWCEQSSTGLCRWQGKGSGTRKAIIETGLFMLVGKGVRIWINPCAHFANYPASLLKEKRAHCRFSSQFHPTEPALTLCTIHTTTLPRSPHHSFSPLMQYGWQCSLNTSHKDPFELNLNWQKIPIRITTESSRKKVSVLDSSWQELFLQYPESKQPYKPQGRHEVN